MRFLRYGWTRKAPAAMAVIVGIVTAVFAWNVINEKVTRATQTTVVVVAIRDIDTYSLVKKGDLVVREVPVAVADKFTARKMEEVVGKVSLAPLYKDKPVDLRFLAEPSDDVTGFQVVGVNVDPARAAGVKPGDLVDVYWLSPDHNGWVPGSGATLVASGVRVLKICDERGNPIAEGSVLQQAVSGGAPGRSVSIVYLAVSPEDVPKVIGGAAPKSSFIALARRPTKEGGTDAEAGEARPGNARNAAGAGE